MTLKGDAKRKEKLSRGLKNDLGNLFNFHVSSQKSENACFNGLLLSKGYKVLDEKEWKCVYCLMTLTSDTKFEEKLTLDSINYMRNLVNFNASSGKFKHLYFDVLILLKVYYV